MISKKSNVKIFIEGKVSDNEKGSITTDTVGEYCLFNGKHIIRYNESDKDKGTGSHNILKIMPGLVEMIKKGENSTRMVFDLSNDTSAVYSTPYGNLRFQITTTKIDIEDKENELNVCMEYSLSNNGSHISDNKIKIAVKEI